MKKSKVLLLSFLVLFLGLGSFSYFYRTSIKRILLKKFKEIFENEHSPEKVSNNKERDFVWGIDISHHQSSINWDILIEKNKPDFIILKATEGSTHIDSKYPAYLKKLHELGIPVGAYHFFSYQSNGKLQAENFIKNSKLTDGDIYPVLDVEFRKNMKDKTWIIHEIKSFCKVIKDKYGVYPIIYCECDYYNKYLKNNFSNFNYWISDLYREPRCEYVIWQYTDKGLVHGIGKIDNNRMHKDKNITDFLLSKPILKDKRTDSKNESNYDKLLLGYHNFSLHWISWDYFGKVEFTKGKTDKNYLIKGAQKSKENDDYIEIEGLITPKNEKHLIFNGVINYKVYHLNNGKPCKREGTFNFKVSGNRKYWRLQEMGNPCDNVADYIDIYLKFD
jgi:lysozyme